MSSIKYKYPYLGAIWEVQTLAERGATNVPTALVKEEAQFPNTQMALELTD
jgi:hypothetical protein